MQFLGLYLWTPRASHFVRMSPFQAHTRLPVPDFCVVVIGTLSIQGFPNRLSLDILVGDLLSPQSHWLLRTTLICPVHCRIPKQSQRVVTPRQYLLNGTEHNPVVEELSDHVVCFPSAAVPGLQFRALFPINSRVMY